MTGNSHKQEKLSGDRYFPSIHANRAHNKLPAHGAKFEGVLMMVLNGKRLPFGCDNFMTAALASVNSGIRCGCAGRIFFIKLDMLGLNKEASILIVRHDRSKLRLTTAAEMRKFDATGEISKQLQYAGFRLYWKLD